MATPQWTPDTTDTFQLHLGQLDAVIGVLMTNITEARQVEEDRPTDEIIFLATQHATHEVRTLEEMSYEYQANAPTGDLSLRLMWARAHLKHLLETCDDANGWKTRLGDGDFTTSLSMVLRLLRDAHQEVDKVHDAVFKKPA